MQKLKQIRQIRGLLQSDLAKLVETSSVNISYLELGRRGLSEYWIDKLSKALNCTKAQLLGEQDLDDLAKLPTEIRQDQRTFLHVIRTKKGMSINELAKRIGVSRQLLWAFENGKKSLSEEVIKRISEEFGVSTEYLATGRDPSNHQISSQKISVVSSNNYPIKDEYLSYAMEIVEEMIDPNFHTREEKTHILSEAYKLVYDFFENNTDKSNFVKDIEQKIIANEGFLKFLNKSDLSHKITAKLLDRKDKKGGKH